MQDFFEATAERSRDLNRTERNIFDFVVKNMDKVKKMSIREFAEAQFLSTTTIFRFTQKLGFSGYSDFTDSLLITAHSKKETAIPNVVMGGNYSEEYLKNAMEAVRVMSPKQVEQIVALLTKKPNIYILTDDNTHIIGQYCERLFIGLGFHAYFPETAYQKRNLANRIGSGDVIIALSYSGQDSMMLDFIERVFLTARPHLLSITRADNNPLESLSDTNFYVFAHEILISGMDLTSNVAMLMIVELLIYEYLVKTEAQ
jgi:RpiR family glv operon transcriptional regulator